MKRYPEAYVEYLTHFHGTRDYFECHELLEEYWKEEQDPELKAVWHGLIQVAVSAYHERRGNMEGARKMLEQAIGRLSSSNPALAGLDPDRLEKELTLRLDRLRTAPAGQRMPYADPELPIADDRLLESCHKLCMEWGTVWNQHSDLGNDQLIHRHTLRNRTDVIGERQRQLNLRGNRLKPGGAEA